jgi:hypothetical protein
MWWFVKVIQGHWTMCLVVGGKFFQKLTISWIINWHVPKLKCTFRLCANWTKTIELKLSVLCQISNVGHLHAESGFSSHSLHTMSLGKHLMQASMNIEWFLTIFWGNIPSDTDLSIEGSSRLIISTRPCSSQLTTLFNREREEEWPAYRYYQMTHYCLFRIFQYFSSTSEVSPYLIFQCSLRLSFDFMRSSITWCLRDPRQ